MRAHKTKSVVSKADSASDYYGIEGNCQLSLLIPPVCHLTCNLYACIWTSYTAVQQTQASLAYYHMKATARPKQVTAVADPHT